MSSPDEIPLGKEGGAHSSTASPEPAPEMKETAEHQEVPMDHSPSQQSAPVSFVFIPVPDSEAIVVSNPDPVNSNTAMVSTIQSPIAHAAIEPRATSIVSHVDNSSTVPPVPQVNVLFMDVALYRGIDMSRQPPFTVTADVDGPCVSLTSHPVSTTDPITGFVRACRHNQSMFAVPVTPQASAARPSGIQYSRGQDHESRGMSNASRGQQSRGGSKRSSSSGGSGRNESESGSTRPKRKRGPRNRKRQTPPDDHDQYAQKHQRRRDDDYDPGAPGSSGRARGSRPGSNTRGSSRRNASGHFSSPRGDTKPVSSDTQDTTAEPGVPFEDLEKDLIPLVVLICEWDSCSISEETAYEQVSKFVRVMAFARVFPEKVRELCTAPLEEHLEGKRKAECDTPEKRIAVFLLLINHLAIVAEVKEELQEFEKQFRRLKESGDPETSTSPSDEHGNNSVHDSNPDPVTDPLAKHYGYYYVPMDTPVDRTLLRNPIIHTAQLRVLEDMASEYRDPVSLPSRPRAGNTYGLYFKTMSRPFPLIKRRFYNDVGYAKWQGECFSREQLTLGFTRPDLWSGFRRDMSKEFPEYMADKFRPRDYSSVDEYIPAICSPTRYYRESREITSHEITLVEDLRCRGNDLPVEAQYMVVFNAELQLHRGIDSRMYQFLGGPLFGFSNPVQFWATLLYILDGTNRDPANYFWVLYYIGVNGNTVKDTAEAVRLASTPEDLERYLQCQQTSKVHDPEGKDCPIHLAFNKKHPKVECMRGIAWSSRLVYFEKYRICMGTQPGSQSQMCLTHHMRTNQCGYGTHTKKPVPFCAVCVDKRHMRPWCPRNAYDDGLYDQFIVKTDRQ